MIGLILADLRRHAAGVVALVLLIASASALGIAVDLSERAVRLGSARAAAAFELVVGAPGSETQLVLSSVFLQPAPLPLLPGRVLAALRSDPRVALAAPVGFGDFVGDDPIVGTTRDAIPGLGGLTQGRAFERLDEAVAGSAVTRPVGSSVRPLHGRVSDGGHLHAGMQYRIVGRMAATGTPWDRAVLVPIEAVWRAHGTEAGEPSPMLAGSHHDDRPVDGTAHRADPIDERRLDDPDAAGVPAILVKPKSIADAYKLRQQYRTDATLAVFPAEVLTRLYGTLGDARTILAAVAAGAQALVSASILLTIIVHVLGRRRQIGALRAFGAPRRAIVAIVWFEVMAIAGGGLLAGLALGIAAASALAKTVGAASGIALPIEPRAEDAYSLLALLAVASIAALVPAALAYRQSPAVALRS